MFNEKFLWGSASAAYQIEGAALTNGKGSSIWDEYSHIKGNTFKDTNGDVAIDFYHKYEEDIELMRDMGLKAYRFSISWPRIMPLGYGEVNPEGVEFYHKVIDKLLDCNIQPIVTLYHWDLPNNLQIEYGGWENRKIIEDFTNYAKVIFNEYGDKVQHWVTLNEQNIFTTLGYLHKLHPPKVADYQRFLNANHNAFLANASAIKLFKDLNIDGLIGPSFAYGPCYAISADPNDVIGMENAQEIQNFLWTDVYCNGDYNPIVKALIKNAGYELPIEDGDLKLLKEGKPTMMGLNYYSTHAYGSVEKHGKTGGSEKMATGNTNQSSSSVDILSNLAATLNNEYLSHTEWNWPIDPIGLRVAMRRLASRYDLPILISENGLGAYDELTEDNKIHDQYRIDYIKKHIDEIEISISEGVNVLGYCTWSCQDLFSWLNGYAKRYGFIYVDRDEVSEKELKRYKKDSYYWYRDVIKSNGKNR